MQPTTGVLATEWRGCCTPREGATLHAASAPVRVGALALSCFRTCSAHAVCPSFPAPPAASLEPEQVRLTRPLQERELGSRIMERLRALAAQERQLAPGAPRAAALPGTAASAAAGGPAAAAAARAAAARAAAPQGSIPSASPFASYGGKSRPLQRASALGGSVRGGAGTLPDPSGSGSAGSAGLAAAPSIPSTDSGAAPLPSTGSGKPPLAPPPAPRKLVLRCSTCGLTTHPTDDCPLAICSPPSLIRPASLPGAHRTASLLLPSRKASLAGAGSGGGGGQEGEWQLPPTPRMLSNEELRAQLTGGEPGGSGGLGGSGSLDATLGGLKPISAGVQVRGESGATQATAQAATQPASQPRRTWRVVDRVDPIKQPVKLSINLAVIQAICLLAVRRQEH